MINITSLDEKHRDALIEWLESDFSTQVFFPLLLQHRELLLGSLVACDNEKQSDITRGRIREINQFLNLHDLVISAQKDGQDQESELDNTRHK